MAPSALPKPHPGSPAARGGRVPHAPAPRCHPQRAEHVGQEEEEEEEGPFPSGGHWPGDVLLGDASGSSPTPGTGPHVGAPAHTSAPTLAPRRGMKVIGFN